MAPKPMSDAVKSLLLVKAKTPAPLDPDFCPVILGKKAYMEAAKDCSEKLEWALPRSDGVARYSLPVFPADNPSAEASVYLAGVLIQEMI